MENTLNLLLQDKTPHWYIVSDSELLGPLGANEIAQNILSGKLSFAAHIWKDGFTGWTRIYEVKDFHPLLPAEPSFSYIEEIQKKSSPPPLSAKKKDELRIWYVYLDEANYGPISDREVRSLIESGRITAATYLWQKGFADWQLAADIPQWSKGLDSGETKKTKEKRTAPRKPFEAKILLTNGKEVGWAICRDVSIGGMQVLMDRAPGSVGALLKLNVNASGGMPGFTCEGTIVRVLEDGRGFSFRFSKLGNEAKAAIERYISS